MSQIDADRMNVAVVVEAAPAMNVYTQAEQPGSDPLLSVSGARNKYHFTGSLFLQYIIMAEQLKKVSNNT
jgi:hypothetical protein